MDCFLDCLLKIQNGREPKKPTAQKPNFGVGGHYVRLLSQHCSQEFSRKLPSAAILIVALIVSKDVEHNKRTPSEFIPQLSSHYNHQVEVSYQFNMWSMSNSSAIIMVDDVRDTLKVFLINLTCKTILTINQPESSNNNSASYTVELFHRAFPFSWQIKQVV